MSLLSAPWFACHGSVWSIPNESVLQFARCVDFLSLPSLSTLFQAICYTLCFDYAPGIA